MKVALSRQGVEVGELQVLRRGSHLVLRGSDNETIVRVRSVAAGEDDREVEQALQRWNRIVFDLLGNGAPIVPPLSVEPARIDESHLAVAWPFGEPLEEPWTELPKLVRLLHDCPPDARLPQWSTHGVRQKVAERLESAAEVPISLRAEISGRAERLLKAPPMISDYVVVHGDAHPGNCVLWNGRPSLIDLDDLALGPRELDLAPMVTALRRFDRKSNAAGTIVSSYGKGLIDESALEWFCELREVTMNSWLASLWSSRPEAQAELVKRVSSWNGAGERWCQM